MINEATLSRLYEMKLSAMVAYYRQQMDDNRIHKRTHNIFILSSIIVYLIYLMNFRWSEVGVSFRRLCRSIKTLTCLSCSTGF